jgi:predicted nucleic acid binding AN1-type Zn finger protein
MQPCPSTCHEKESLTATLHLLRIQYAFATNQLETMDAADFKAAMQRAHQAKTAYESARKALKAHTTDHGC